jgi:hypothetical protein
MPATKRPLSPSTPPRPRRAPRPPDRYEPPATPRKIAPPTWVDNPFDGKASLRANVKVGPALPPLPPGEMGLHVDGKLRKGAWLARVFGRVAAPKAKKSPHALLLDDGLCIEPFRNSRGQVDFDLSAWAATNEPPKGKTASAVLKLWYRRNGSFEAALHAARALDSEEITWWYGNEYEPHRRHAAYQAGSAAKLCKKDVPAEERP